MSVLESFLISLVEAASAAFLTQLAATLRKKLVPAVPVIPAVKPAA
jgi:hypothetical protein